MAIATRSYSIIVGQPQDLDVAQGEDREFLLTFIQPPNGPSPGAPVDFTGISSATMTVRDANGTLIFARLFTGGAPIGPPTAGTLGFTVNQADTSARPAGPYLVDVTWIDAGGDKAWLLAASRFVLNVGVSKPGDPISTPPGAPLLGLTTAALTLTSPGATVVKYYVSPTGSDASDGSIASPFRTTQHALDVWATFARGRRLEIICIGGVNELGNIVVPPFYNSDPLVFGIDPDCLAFLHKGYVTIKAAPTLVDTMPALGTTSAADAIVSELVTLSNPGKTFTPGALVGLYAIGSGPFEFGPVTANDAHSFEAPSITGSFTLPVQLVQLAATYTAPSGTGGAFTVDGVKAKILFEGIKLAHQDAGGQAVQGAGADFVEFMLCDVQAPSLQHAGTVNLYGSTMRGAGGGTTTDAIFFGDSLAFFASRLYQLTPDFVGGSCRLSGAVVDSSRFLDTSGGPGIGLDLEGVAFRVQGLLVMGIARLVNVRADACVPVAHVNIYGSGIHVIGGNVALSEGLIGGSGNAGAGLEIDVGAAWMETTEPVTLSITGALGDLKVGRLAPIAWAEAVARGFVADQFGGSFFGIGDDSSATPPVTEVRAVPVVGAAPTTIARIPLPPGKLLRIECDLTLVGHRTDGGGLDDYCVMLFRSVWKNVGGVLTNIRAGGDFALNAESIGTMGPCSLQSVASGPFVLLQAIGIDGATIAWAGSIGTIVA